MQTIYEKLARCSSASEIKRMLAGNGVVVAPPMSAEEFKLAVVTVIRDHQARNPGDVTYGPVT